jgi:phenylacetate-coenzyme A ligase PaaK-like adenylate-forming protein
MPLHPPKITGQEFQSPLRLPSRTAALEAGFAPHPAIRSFTADDIGPLVDYEPESLILPLLLALALADQRRRPQPSNWMVVLTSLAGVPFEDRHRDQLWRAYGVPVFEQLKGWDGAIVARECEVHDGLHVDENNAILETHEGELITTQLTTVDQPILRAKTGLTAELIHHHCECGSETPRLRNLAPLHQQKARSAVA